MLPTGFEKAARLAAIMVFVGGSLLLVGYGLDLAHLRAPGWSVSVRVATVAALLAAAGLILQIWRNATALRDLEAARLNALTALAVSEAQTQSIIENSLDAVISMNSAGQTTYWNRSAEAMFGWSREEAFGRDVADLIMPERFRQRHQSGLEDYLRTGYGPILGRRIETFGLRRNGTEFPIELTVVALGLPDAPVFNAFLSDITERKRAEENLRFAEQRKSSLLRLSTSLQTAASFEGVLEAALHEISEILNYRLLTMFVFSDDGRTASLIDVQGDLDAEARRELVVLQVAGDRFLEELYVARDIVLVEDARVDPRTNKELVAKVGCVSIVAAPVMLAERKIGAVCTGTSEAEGIRLPARPELDYFSQMASHVAVAFDRIRLLAERERAIEETRALNRELNARVVERTKQLENANRELEAFSYSVSHDLRAPLRHIDAFSRILLEDFGPGLDPAAQRYLGLIRKGALTMGRMIDDLLQLARVERRDLVMKDTPLDQIVREVIDDARSDLADREIDWTIGPLPVLRCDPGLIKLVFTNLLANAIKYTRGRKPARISITQIGDGPPVIAVSDNGAGFDERYAGKLFGVFQRLHRAEEFEGTGVGLATVQRIVHKHGGRIWAKAAVDAGATFFFTLSPVLLEGALPEDAGVAVRSEAGEGRGRGDGS